MVDAGGDAGIDATDADHRALMELEQTEADDGETWGGKDLDCEDEANNKECGGTWEGDDIDCEDEANKEECAAALAMLAAADCEGDDDSETKCRAAAEAAEKHAAEAAEKDAATEAAKWPKSGPLKQVRDWVHPNISV